MATRTKDMAHLRKEKRGTSSSSTTKTKPNQISSTKNKQTLTQGKRLPSLHDPNIHNKQTLNRGQSFDRPPSLSGDGNTQGKNPSLSNGASIVQNKPNQDRRRSIGLRPPPPSTTLCDPQVKKLASSSSDSNIHNKQTSLARRSSLDYRAALTSGLDTTQGKKLTSSSSDPNIHNKLILTRTLDHKPSLSSPTSKSRTSPNPKERILKPTLSLPSKISTSRKPHMNKLSKIPHASKDVAGKKQSTGLYVRAVKPESPTGLTSNTFVTTTLTDIVDNVTPKAEELEHIEHHEPIDKTYDEMEVAEAGESTLVMEDYEGLNETVNIDEYLKAAESSSLYVVENQEVIKVEAPEEQELVEETIISNYSELEEINHEASKPDLEEIEKQEIEIIKPINEDKEEEAMVEESDTIVKALDDCQQEKKESEEIEEKVLDVNIQAQEKEEEFEGRENGKESKEMQQENKSTMAFAKPYLHLVHKKDNVVSNDVIEETASKLIEQRKNRVKALAGAFETVISLQDPRA